MAARRPARDARRSVPLAQAYRLFGSNPLVMVTSVGKRGPDVMTCAWCTPYDFNPPHLLLVIDPASLTAANIRATGVFAVHSVNEALARLAVRCGSVRSSRRSKSSSARATPRQWTYIFATGTMRSSCRMLKAARERAR